MQVDNEPMRGSLSNATLQRFGVKSHLGLEAGRKIQPLQENSVDQSGILAAVSVFHEMQQYGLKPNVVTFSAILNACR